VNDFLDIHTETASVKKELNQEAISNEMNVRPIVLNNNDYGHLYPSEIHISRFTLEHSF
jgi:hypothetical protein